MVILPEKGDKWSSQKKRKVAKSSKPKAMVILPKKVDKYKKGKTIELSMPIAMTILPEKVDK